MKKFFERFEEIVKKVLTIVTPLLALYRVIKDILTGGNSNA